jgi:cytochrome c oxidase subunit 2
MAIAIVLIMLVVGSVTFHLMSPWYFTEIASNWGMIDNTVTITFWVCGIVFVVLNLFMAYAIIKYRHREGHKAKYDPENKKLEWWLTIVTSIGVIAMLAPGLFVWAQFVDVPEDADIVEVVGQQWQWSFRYPGADGRLGTVDAHNISIDNPFGMNPDDPLGQDDVLIDTNQFRLPVNRQVKLLIRSKDVLHNFTVPQFRVKMDLVPGMVPFIWLTPTRVGTYDILCEELCGIGHHAMRGKVMVEEENDFNQWLAQQPTYAELTFHKHSADMIAGKALYQTCSVCHGEDGQGIQALNAPKISGQQDWYLKRQLHYFKTGVRGSAENDIYGKQMAPMALILANDKAVNDVVTFITTLPDKPTPHTIQGDLNKGEDIYLTCGKCHGLSGKGNWALRAPRIAGMSDWYMVTQLKNFKLGARGAHPDDSTGYQMTSMVLSLTEEKVNAVVAYMNTF